MNGLSDTVSTLALIERWTRHGWLRALDGAFANFLVREEPTAAPLLILGAALTSHQLGRGHPCLDLGQTLDDPDFALSLPPESGRDATEMAPPLPSTVLKGVTLADWQAALVAPELVSAGPGNTPLVIAGSRLYLRRYWQYEHSIWAGIEARLGQTLPLREDVLSAALTVLFPPVPGIPGPDWQKLGCALAARSAFAIVTGGPGTGKTTTVVRLLAVLQAMALAMPPPRPLRIRLAAPTGKAAARLKEAIAKALAGLPRNQFALGGAIVDAIPTKATTLHRLLGSRPDTRHFTHHAGNPLPVDVLVVDEASMIDLEMLAAVLAALPATARLILLGDKDQLASVEAGAVLGELCRRAEQGHYTPDTAAWLDGLVGKLPPKLVDSAGTSLDQTVAMLRHSFRFNETSGIGRLAKAVNSGDVQALERVLAHGHADLARVQLGGTEATEGKSEAMLRRLVINDIAFDCSVADAAAMPERPVGYRYYLTAMKGARPQPGASQVDIDRWAAKVLAAHEQFQLLSPLRRGPWGVEGLNQRISDWLHSEGLIAAAEGWYAGRPVLVTRNDYGLGLMNGDIGITLELPTVGSAGPLRVAFPAGDGNGGIKWVQPSRLQAVETVYALTVHKAQGSEFTHAAMVLPDRINPILTRELVYTGITRSSRWFSLVEAGKPAVLEQAVRRRVLRLSGLLTGSGK